MLFFFNLMTVPDARVCVWPLSHSVSSSCRQVEKIKINPSAQQLVHRVMTRNNTGVQQAV